MLIWRRMGFLAFVFCYGGLLTSQLVVNAIFGAGSYRMNSPLWGGIGLFVGGIATLTLGLHLKRKDKDEQSSGPGDYVHVGRSNPHTLYWIPMEYWGGLSTLGGSLMMLSAALNA